MLELIFFSKLDLGFYIIPTDNRASKKLEALVCSMKFLSHEVALYLYKSTICPCMDYCCHVWAVVPSCYLELLDKLNNEYARLLVLHLLLLLNTLAHQNVASLSLFYRYLVELVPVPFS